MAGIAAVALAGCGGASSSKDYSSTIAQSVMTNGAQQVQATASSLGGGGATMKDANCVQTADTETYTCIAHYAYTDASGNTYQ